MKYSYILVLTLSAVFITPSHASAGHEGNTFSSSKKHNITRWYNRSQVSKGNDIFQAHCASCHQADASGVKNWRIKDETGAYPPPPLNGTAHTWHHNLDVLRRTVRLGGKRLGGTMPGFSEKLTDQQVDSVLAWVQSNWPDNIYEAWFTRNRL